MTEHVESIEALHPAIEATIEERTIDTAKQYHVVVLRLAEDGWCGWAYTTDGNDKDEVIAGAMIAIKERLARRSREGLLNILTYGGNSRSNATTLAFNSDDLDQTELNDRTASAMLRPCLSATHTSWRCWNHDRCQGWQLYRFRSPRNQCRTKWMVGAGGESVLLV